MKASRAIIKQNKLLEQMLERLDKLQKSIDSVKPKTRKPYTKGVKSDEE